MMACDEKENLHQPDCDVEDDRPIPPGSMRNERHRRDDRSVKLKAGRTFPTDTLKQPGKMQEDFGQEYYPDRLADRD